MAALLRLKVFLLLTCGCSVTESVEQERKWSVALHAQSKYNSHGWVAGSEITTAGLTAALLRHPRVRAAQVFAPFVYQGLLSQQCWDVLLIEGWTGPVPAVIHACREKCPNILVLHWVLDTYPSLPTVLALDVDGYLTNSRALLSILGRSAPALYLPLAADPNVMSPGEARPEYAHPVVYLGQASLTKHRLLEVLLEVRSLGLAIYGLGWDRFPGDPNFEALLPHYRGVLPKDSIAALYSSAGVVLGTTEVEQRGLGMVNNRVFEVLACGGVFVSDGFPALDELVGSVVLVHDSAGDALNHARRLLSNETARAARKAMGRELVLRAHTYDHRVEELLPWLDELNERTRRGRRGLRANMPKMLLLYDPGDPLDVTFYFGLIPALLASMSAALELRPVSGLQTIGRADLDGFDLVLARAAWGSALADAVLEAARTPSFRDAGDPRGHRWAKRGALGLLLRGPVPAGREAGRLSVLDMVVSDQRVEHPNTLISSTVDVAAVREGSEGWAEGWAENGTASEGKRWAHCAFRSAASQLCDLAGPRAVFMTEVEARGATELCGSAIVIVRRPEAVPRHLRSCVEFRLSDEDSPTSLYTALASGCRVHAPPALAPLLEEVLAASAQGAESPLSAVDTPAFAAQFDSQLGRAMFGPRAAAAIRVLSPPLLQEKMCGTVEVRVEIDNFRVPDDGLFCLVLNGTEVACIGDASFSASVSICGPTEVKARLRGGDLESPDVIFESSPVGFNYIEEEKTTHPGAAALHADAVSSTSQGLETLGPALDDANTGGLVNDGADSWMHGGQTACEWVKASFGPLSAEVEADPQKWAEGWAEDEDAGMDEDAGVRLLAIDRALRVVSFSFPAEPLAQRLNMAHLVPFNFTFVELAPVGTATSHERVKHVVDPTDRSALAGLLASLTPEVVLLPTSSRPTLGLCALAKEHGASVCLSADAPGARVSGEPDAVLTHAPRVTVGGRPALYVVPAAPLADAVARGLVVHAVTRAGAAPADVALFEAACELAGLRCGLTEGPLDALNVLAGALVTFGDEPWAFDDALAAAARGMALVAIEPGPLLGEVVCSGWNGVSPTVRGPRALAAALLAGLEEASEGGREGTLMGNRGRRYVRRRFAPSRAAQSFAATIASAHRAATQAPPVPLESLGLRAPTRPGPWGSEPGGSGPWGSPGSGPRASAWDAVLPVPAEGRGPRVAVLFYRAPDHLEATFEVGFMAALRLAEATGAARFTPVNLHLVHGRPETEARAAACAYFERYDAVMVKSNWEWCVDTFAQQYLADCTVPRIILVSGSYPPPSLRALFVYQVCVFEVYWYARAHLSLHPATVHGFGIDVRGLKSQNTTFPEKTLDLLFIGALADHMGHKRPHLIGEKLYNDQRLSITRTMGVKEGRRAVVGKQDGRQAEEVAAHLRSKGVAILQPVPYRELAQLIQSSHAVYVSDNVLGGGERVVLEARQLGADVQIEGDNPKLKELLSSPVYDHSYYAEQLIFALGLLQFELAVDT